jgi:hypothetical protein
VSAWEQQELVKELGTLTEKESTLAKFMEGQGYTVLEILKVIKKLRCQE